MKLVTYKSKFWNPKTQQEDTRLARALFVWRFRVWAYDPGTWVWTVEIHVRNSPQIVRLDRRGWFRHNFDWSYHWYVHIGLGKVGISYDENAHQRHGWEFKYRYNRDNIVKVLSL